MNETGVVKFQYQLDEQDLADFPGFAQINAVREEFKALGLLGVDGNGIGFGNVSLRDGNSDSFYITGSGTGARTKLGLQDYARVIAWDFDRNWLRCAGRVIASAESLTHAAVYEADSTVRVIMHGHHRNLWRALLERGVSTRPDVPYGTPEMAREVQRLFRETNLKTKKLFAMTGHADGIVAFGPDFVDALATLTGAFGRTR